MIRLFATTTLLVLATALPCTLVGGEQPPKKPLVLPLSKDPNTSLHTISIKNGAPLVVDLAGSLVWSTCPSTHSTFPWSSATCRVANQHRPRRCRYVDPGWSWANCEPSQRGCACDAHPINPVTVECSTGDLTTFAVSANTTSGTVPLALHPESLTVAGSCAPDRLLKSLPAGAAGVAGFSRRPLSLPSQLSSQRKFGNTFALCMPGFALFGNTSIKLGWHLPDLTSTITYTPLVVHPRNGAYYLPVKSIRMGWALQDVVKASLPAGALDLDVKTGRGGVVLSTVTPYMAMRSDVYRAFSQAYDTTMRGNGYGVKRLPAVWPFELCYDTSSLPPLGRYGIDLVVPHISLELAGATHNRPWPVPMENYLVIAKNEGLKAGVVCAGVVEMGRAAASAGVSTPPVEDEPAVVLGNMQLEERLLVFDLDKGVLGFSDLLRETQATCSNL